MANKFDYSGDGTLGRLLTRLKSTLAGYAKQSEVDDLSKAIADYQTITLGVHTDGLVYIFKNDVPVGVGIELPEGGGGLSGYVDSENNIVLRGDYLEGTLVKYEMADGTVIDIGEMVFEKEPEYAEFTNLFDASKAIINQRVNSSNALTGADGYVVSGAIDVSAYTITSASKIYVKGAKLSGSNSKTLAYKTFTEGSYAGTAATRTGATWSQTEVDEGNGVYSYSNLTGFFQSGVKTIIVIAQVSTSKITADDIKDIIITIDEPIYTE